MKAIHGLPLLLFTLLSTAAAASTSTSSCAATTFIKSTCNTTTYPNLCDKITLPYANKIKCDLQRMSNYALKVALGAAKNSSKTVSGLSKENGLDSSEKAAVKDCVELVKDSVAQIKDSIGELGGLKNASSDGDRKFKLSNIKTWMSAALTDYETCLDGLDEQEVESNVKSKITVSIQDSSMYSSISLAIVSKIQ